MRRTVPLWATLVEIDQRAGSLASSIPLLSVSKTKGIVRYEELFPDRQVRAEDLSNYKLVEPGEIVLNKMSAATGAVGRATERGLVSPDYAVLRVNPSADSSYLSYLLSSDGFCRNEVEPRLQGIGVGDVSNARTPRVTMTSYLNPAVFIPNFSTQQRIADFLDRETGEIDAMIAKMDELAETLESRRIESITSAVSGATSTNRVQTGSVWFPTVPRGWRTSSVQLLSAGLTDGAHISPETENGEYDFVSTRDVRHGVIDFEGSLKTSASSYEYLVRTGCRPRDGDILFSKDGTVGETAIVKGAPEFVVASSLIIVTPTRSLVTSEFLRYALESGPAQRAARSYTRGSGLPRISVVNFGRGVVVPVPPTLEEQKRIADHLDEVTGKIDQMLAKVAELKSLLTERRATLITEVVTGRKEVA